MKAKEMFEELGYKRNAENKKITYSQNFGNGYFKIIFDLSNDGIEIVSNIGAEIENDLLHVIIQQCKELGWLESEQKQQTNLDHYLPEILKNCMPNLAVVKGKPKQCNLTSCCDCEFHKDQPQECHKRAMKWLKQQYIKPTYELTIFENDLLQSYSNIYKYKFKAIPVLTRMKEKGYFKGVDEDATIRDILANCEITEED